MATDSQIIANQQNALHSTGPRTDAGKVASSRNSLTLGLFTRGDYVKPEERDIYKQFCETMQAELSPLGLLEQTLTEEITGASWRLRRCSAVEAELADYKTQDPMLDETTERTRRSLERARSSAHSLLHRSINQLRKTQTERHIWHELTPPNQVAANFGLGSYNEIIKALNTRDSGQLLYAAAKEATRNSELASNCKEPRTPSGSFCKPASALSSATPVNPQIPRSAPCPCRSGEKYKRCCGTNAPPVLGQRAA